MKQSLDHAREVYARQHARLVIFLPYLLLSLAVLAWAGNWVVGRAMRDDMGPVAMGFWRWALALALILPFSARELRRKWDVVRRNIWWLTVSGAVGAVMFNAMIYVGLQYTATTNSVLFNSVVPVLIVIISGLVLGEKVSVRQVIGILISLIGVLTIVSRGNPSTLAMLQFNRGDVWIMTAMLFWAVYTILLRWRPRELSAIAFLAAMLMFSLPLLLPFYAWELVQRGSFELSALSVTVLAYYATVPSVVAYLMWNYGVAKVGPNRAGLIVHLLPIFAAILAVLFLGERLYAYHYIGTVFVFGGIWLTTRAPVTASS
jgi:drug/metabolite transporter (DMT)-like permease